MSKKIEEAIAAFAAAIEEDSVGLWKALGERMTMEMKRELAGVSIGALVESLRDVKDSSYTIGLVAGLLDASQRSYGVSRRYEVAGESELSLCFKKFADLLLARAEKMKEPLDVRAAEISAAQKRHNSGMN